MGNRICTFGGKFFLLTVGKFSLCAPFGLRTLLFESLHFFLTFLERSGHKVSFVSECIQTKSPTHRLGLLSTFTGLARGFL